MPVFYNKIEAVDAFAKMARKNEPAPAQLAYLVRLRPKAEMEELVSDANAIAAELHPLGSEIELEHKLHDRVTLSLKTAWGTYKMDCFKASPVFRVFEDERA